MLISNKKGFSVFELIIVIMLISVGFLSMYSVVTEAITSTGDTRKEIIAINIAREGMEAVFNIKDTNWLKRSGKRDKCWLKIDPLNDENSDGLCENDTWFQSGVSYTLSGGTANGQKYFMLSGTSTYLDIKNNIGTSTFGMCNDKGYWYHCPGDNLNAKEGRFYRAIEGKGLIDKTSSSLSFLDCLNGEGPDSECGNNTTKEMIFCSKVEFYAGRKDDVTLCSSLTNYLE